MVLEYYSSGLIYTNLHGGMDPERRYGKGALSISLKEFWTFVVHISDDVTDSNPKIYHAWVVPAGVNPLHCSSDLWYLEEDKTSRIGRPVNGEKINAEFFQTILTES